MSQLQLYVNRENDSQVTPNTQAFEYNGTIITFELNGQVMVNATQMAKAFNQSPTFYLRNQKSKEYIDALSEMRNCNSTDLVKVIHGDPAKQGTWMHEDVALDFAQWLSPKFKVWCILKIKELLKTGSTSIHQKSSFQLPENFSELLRALADKLDEPREDKAKDMQIEILKAQVAELKPKGESFDRWLSSTGLTHVADAAKNLGTGGVRLMKWLRDNKIVDKDNVAYQSFVDKGYFIVKQYVYEQHGELLNCSISLLTPAGCDHISKLYKNEIPSAKKRKAKRIRAVRIK